ncbi:hypothetical protein [Deinococcus roseus]|uniref:hypothetical protein n=1 Tax=Deinococcus roseus TaxID=392414 RepID=UPI00166957BE|nr:hypothetical protein [Deinococcus roseus]
MERTRYPHAPLHTSQGHIIADLQQRPQNSHVLRSARLGWSPDLWENFMGRDPLRFEDTDQVRAYSSKHTPGLDEDTVEDLLRHWQAAVALDWIDKNWH